MNPTPGQIPESSVRHQGAAGAAKAKGPNIFWPLTVVLLVSLIAIGWLLNSGMGPAKETTGPAPGATH